MSVAPNLNHNTFTRPPGPRLSARPDHADRIDRLAGLLDRAAHAIVDTASDRPTHADVTRARNQLVAAIAHLHDDRGELVVTWRREPTGDEKLSLILAWEAVEHCRDGWECVEHVVQEAAA